MNQDTIQHPDTQPEWKSILARIWRGEGGKSWGLRLIVIEVLIFFVTGFVYNVALSTLRWPSPFTILGYISLVMALLGSLLFVWLAVRYVRDIGAKRVLFRLAIVYFFYLAIRVVLDLPSFPGFDGAWFSVRNANQDIAAYSVGFTQKLYQAPDEISFAITGRRKAIPVNSVAATPVELDFGAQGVVRTDGSRPLQNSSSYPPQTALPQSNTSSNFSIGQQARVSGTEGAGLRLRKSPSLNAAVTVRLRDDTVIAITDGPQYADGHTWWHVKHPTGDGWCVDEYLKPMGN